MAIRIPETPRLVLTLTVAGLLSGTFLVGVDEVTAPMIADNRAAFYEKAGFDVLPGAERLERLDWTDAAQRHRLRLGRRPGAGNVPPAAQSGRHV